jgi:hypothetical protein
LFGFVLFCFVSFRFVFVLFRFCFCFCFVLFCFLFFLILCSYFMSDVDHFSWTAVAVLCMSSCTLFFLFPFQNESSSSDTFIVIRSRNELLLLQFLIGVIISILVLQEPGFNNPFRSIMEYPSSCFFVYSSFFCFFVYSST